MIELDRLAARLDRASTFDTPRRGWTALLKVPSADRVLGDRKPRSDVCEHSCPLHCMPASCPPSRQAEGPAAAPSGSG
eukprot:4626775-Prymnesium_polylepis.1